MRHRHLSTCGTPSLAASRCTPSTRPPRHTFRSPSVVVTTLPLYLAAVPCPLHRHGVITLEQRAPPSVCVRAPIASCSLSVTLQCTDVGLVPPPPPPPWRPSRALATPTIPKRTGLTHAVGSQQTRQDEHPLYRRCRGDQVPARHAITGTRRRSVLLPCHNWRQCVRISVVRCVCVFGSCWR